jgi:hypothetical protein
MPFIIKILLILVIYLLQPLLSAQTIPKPTNSTKQILNFIEVGGNRYNELSKQQLKWLEVADGVQVLYFWRFLETEEGKYDFSIIEKDLAYYTSLNKKMFIQIQDRNFSTKWGMALPKYLFNDKKYGGGMVAQWDNPGEGVQSDEQAYVPIMWNDELKKRYQALMIELAKQFDGRIYGINIEETSIDLSDIDKKATGFSSDLYFKTLIDNILHLRKVFTKSFVVQYVNFFPDEWNNDKKYMSRFFEFAQKNNIGVGGLILSLTTSHK